MTSDRPPHDANPVLGVGISQRDADIAALGWWLGAGVDTLVADTPRDWLRRPARRTPAQPRSSAPAFVSAPPRGDRGIAELARAATTPDALRAALATLAADPVFIDGDPACGLLILGDAPSFDDARAGTPFTGAPGRLLGAMLAAIGRPAACVGNVSFWPDAAHGEVTMPVVARLLELARPRAVLAMGAGATAVLTGSGTGFNRLRGRWHETKLGGEPIAVLPTFAPAHLIAHPAHKALAWDDLLLLQTRIAA